MNKNILSIAGTLAAITILISSCRKDSPVINYEYGTFPDSVINMVGINSQYDDYNMALPQITGTLPVMFSSNRKSLGAEFDIVSGLVFFIFDQISGKFTLNSEMYNSEFFGAIENHVNNTSDQLGPYRFFNSNNGMEFFLYTSPNEGEDLDIMFMEYSPSFYGEVPYMEAPVEATRLSSSSDDGYFAIDWDIENVYLTSDRGGDFDIYTAAIDLASGLGTWLTGEPSELVNVSSVNSEFDEKCPFIYDTYMVFTSNRSGGFGGYDLYYSKYGETGWGSPVNFGPRINTEYDEYRPVVGYAAGYTNNFMIFSSDRPGGVGNFDLYFTGVTFE